MPLISLLISYDLEFIFAIIYLIITFLSLKLNSRYDRLTLFFVFLLFFFILIGFLIRNNFLFLRYTYIFYFGVLNYIIFSNQRNNKFLPIFKRHFDKIYLIILFTLFLEFIFNIFSFEDLFSVIFQPHNNIRGYQRLHSRPISILLNINFPGLNSLFFGPQAASTLISFCIIYYNPIEKLKGLKTKSNFILSLVLFFLSPTVTLTIILILLLFYYIFISRFSILNSVKNKFYFFLFTIPLTYPIVQLFFSILLSGFSFYIEVWMVPVKAFFSTNYKILFFGIPQKMEINDFSINHEFGLIEVSLIAGIMPLIFIIIYLLFIKHKYKEFVRNLFKNKINYEFYNSFHFIRISIITIIVSFLTLFHYSSIFSFGFNQLVGLHLGVFLYLVNFKNSHEI